MGNRITCDRLPGAASIEMSNGLTSIVLSVLAMAGARRAVSAWERRLVYWLADHDQELVGRGTVGFDVADLGWTADALEAQRGFVLAMIDGALAREGWDRLGYQPREESVRSVLRQLRGLIEALPDERLEPVGDWLPDELPTKGDCALHGVPLARLGCMVCNDAGLGPR